MTLLALKAFDNLWEQGVAELLQAKEHGTKVVGLYCTYSPKELIIAAGAIPVGLCGTREATITAAERDLPRNLCPMIKSSYGLAITNQCPYFLMSDLVIGETTCDGKKKMFEVLREKNIKNIFVMHLPQFPDEETSLQLWHAELKRLMKYMEDLLGVAITPDALRKAMRITNEENRSKKRLFDLNKRIPALISGMDMVKVSFQGDFQADRMEGVRLIDNLCDSIESSAIGGYAVGNAATKRILLTGTPVGEGTEKVVQLTEECGALIVAMENCGGYKTVEINADPDDPREPLLVLAEKYLKIPCSVMTPNQRRIDLLRRMVRDFHIDGVIDLTWQACHTYNVESYFVSRLVEKELGLPFLQLETDYSQSDIETLRVRIEAFLETVTRGTGTVA
jgi:benzoyl-CoA reductase/2-hydroxyglutaryl-CoA dehydratase subunit BcrC/BadD/HgdB